tara:strand:- start:2216 stop:2929 length:714 start_codon:yes stop_codon:yes gene_type:complete
MPANIFVTNIVTDIINNAINNIINKSFYLIKYSSISKSYISSNVLYKNIINNENIKNYKISDVLLFTSKNLKTILPIPILNGRYISEDLYINELPSKLIIIFVNMNLLKKSSYPLSINNSTALNYIMNMFSNTTTPIIPPPPMLLPLIPPPPPYPPPLHEVVPINQTILNEVTINPINPLIGINNTQGDTFLNINKERYKNQINILKGMGFDNEHKILEALIVSDGDINSAIHYYLR